MGSENRNPAQRRSDLVRWSSTLTALAEAVNLLLRMLREKTPGARA